LKNIYKNINISLILLLSKSKILPGVPIAILIP
jgi:hypothetical protein